MVGWKFHILGGIVFSSLFFAYLVLTNNFRFDYLFVAIPLIFIFSLLPDCDLPSSKLTQIIMFSSSTINIIFMVLIAFNMIDFIYAMSSSFILFITMIFTLFPHRGITHTLTFTLLVSIPIFKYFGLFVAIVAFLSYWSHLWLDIYHGGKFTFYPLRVWGAVR
jgi:hypothetical protein